jgi:lipoprotein-anchoring transpeptidase ErfK/SrfK
VGVASYRNQLWIAVLLASCWIPALAQAPAGSVQAQSAVLRVTSPQSQQRQTENFVTVHYELQNPTSAPSGSPNFQVQLDGQDPITTATTEQSFTGLTAGQHVVTVRLVDANGTAIPDSQTQVQFFVVPTAQNGGATGTQAPTAQGNQTTSPTPQAMNKDSEPSANVQMAGVLPEGSLLPVAGIVGFSFLLGGIVCGALKPPRP